MRYGAISFGRRSYGYRARHHKHAFSEYARNLQLLARNLNSHLFIVRGNNGNDRVRQYAQPRHISQQVITVVTHHADATVPSGSKLGERCAGNAAQLHLR